MVFYQFQQAGNEEYQSKKKWNIVVGIVAAGNNGTVAGTVPKFTTHDNFATIANFRCHSEFSLSLRIFAIIANFRCVRNFLLLFFLSKKLRFWFLSFLPSL